MHTVENLKHGYPLLRANRPTVDNATTKKSSVRNYDHISALILWSMCGTVLSCLKVKFFVVGTSTFELLNEIKICK
jgi:hypothetical protein